MFGDVWVFPFIKGLLIYFVNFSYSLNNLETSHTLLLFLTFILPLLIMSFLISLFSILLVKFINISTIVCMFGYLFKKYIFSYFIFLKFEVLLFLIKSLTLDIDSWVWHSLLFSIWIANFSSIIYWIFDSSHSDL